MNPSLQHHLRELDRALLALLDERARLVAQCGGLDRGRASALDDLLRRHDGPFPAVGVREVFAAIDRHCAGFAAESGR